MDGVRGTGKSQFPCPILSRVLGLLLSWHGQHFQSPSSGAIELQSIFSEAGFRAVSWLKKRLAFHCRGLEDYPF